MLSHLEDLAIAVEKVEWMAPQVRLIATMSLVNCRERQVNMAKPWLIAIWDCWLICLRHG